MKKILYSAMCCFIAMGAAKAQPQLRADNIDEIVAAMTLEEKAELLVGYTSSGNSYFGLPTATDPNAQDIVLGAAGQTNTISRLGIPHTVVADGPAGLRISPTRPNDNNTYYCTGFPVATLLASTWNTDLVYQVGQAMGSEVRDYGVDVLLAPGMNLMRNPLCGRNFEYYSEDPLVTGKMAAAFVNGVQSQDVGTSVKHYAANNQETNRMAGNSIVSQRAMRELYLKGFEIVVKEAQPWTVMSSYNRLNGPFTQEDYELLTTVLRDEWGFEGIVMTDWTGPRNTSRQVSAGNDLMMPGSKPQIDQIIADGRSGVLPMADIDLCVKRILEYVVKTPRFKNYRYSNRPDLQGNASVTRNSATEGMVLLKNEANTLPLASDVKEIALFGNTSYDFIAGGTGSGHVNKAYVVDLLEGLSNVGYTVNTRLQSVYKSYMSFEQSKQQFGEANSMAFLGSGERAPELALSQQIIASIARESDIAVITIGRNSGEFFDRTIPGDFELTNVERELINNITNEFHKVGKKAVVILNVGGVVETASWKSVPDAILLAWQAGQEGGNSVADVLKGNANPSGKLPMTFPLNYFDVPSALDFPYDYTAAGQSLTAMMNPTTDRNNMRKNVDYTEYNEGINVGYRYYQTAGKAVSYPFGYGLSYTTFEYSNPRVSQSGSNYTVSVTVKNTGSVAGKEVVQLYVAAPGSSIEKPESELRAFTKTRQLNPGESQTVTMTFTNYDLASFHESESAWITDAGRYTAKVGASVEDIRATATFNASKQTYPANNVLNYNRPE